MIDATDWLRYPKPGPRVEEMVVASLGMAGPIATTTFGPAMTCSMVYLKIISYHKKSYPFP